MMTNQPSNQLPLGSSSEASELPLPNFRTAPQRSGQFSSEGSPLYKGLPNFRTELAGVGNTDSELNVEEILADLSETRERLLAGVDYLYRHCDDEDRFTRGRHRLVHILTGEYLPCINQLRTASSADDLVARRNEAERRMAIGWTVDKPGAVDRFSELSVLYGVLSDALADSAIGSWLDRIGRLEVAAA